MDITAQMKVANEKLEGLIHQFERYGEKVNELEAEVEMMECGLELKKFVASQTMNWTDLGIKYQKDKDVFLKKEFIEEFKQILQKKEAIKNAKNYKEVTDKQIRYYMGKVRFYTECLKYNVVDEE